MKKIFTTLFLFILFISQSQGQSSTGLNFDGVDDRCTISDNAAYDLGTGDFTVEAWIKANSAQNVSFPTIFSNRETGNVGSGMLVYLSGGRLTLQMDGINTPSAGNDLRDNICHHIAVTRNAGNVNFYIDGVFQSAIPSYNYNINAAHGFWIGRDDPAPSTTPFKGLIHEVRFWNIARTQTQIQTSKDVSLSGTETGLIGYWQMNEGSGQTINDLSPILNSGFLGTVNSSDPADPLYQLNACTSCYVSAIISAGGPTTFCVGESVLLSANTGTGLSYQWRKDGLNIFGATASIYPASFSGSYSVIVSNSCGSSVSSPVIVTVNPLPTATITAAGPTTFCTGGSVVLNANTGTGLTYQWKLNGIDIYASPPPTTSYTATVSGSYTVVVTNSCGTMTSSPIVVTVLTTVPSLPGSISGSASFCSNQTGVAYSIAPVANATTYTWLVPQGATVATGQGTVSITVNFGTKSGNIKVAAGNPCGTSAYKTKKVTKNCRMGEGEEENENEFSVKVFPNPSSEDFTFEITNAVNENLSIEIFDAIGKLVLNETHHNPKFESDSYRIRSPELIPGVYSVLITSGDLRQAVRIVKTE